MTRLVFEMADVLRCAKHSLAAPVQLEVLVGYSELAQKPLTRPVKLPALDLVHDHGVYLMSHGSPRDLVCVADVVQENPPGEVEVVKKYERSFVAYAQGCDPTQQTFEEWWEESRRLVGGDDFVEVLEGWPAEIVAAAERGAVKVVVYFGKRTLRLDFLSKPRKGGKRP